jgi:DNA-binding transcriptional LysR family regulator
MQRHDLSTLAVFFAVAEQRSFTRAGKRLGVSPSAMSHAIRDLEEDLGVRLLSRTTRSVAPTEAGERLLTRLRPALNDVQDVLDELSGLRDKPVGRVRLLVPRVAGTAVLGPKLAQFYA